MLDYIFEKQIKLRPAKDRKYYEEITNTFLDVYFTEKDKQRVDDYITRMPKSKWQEKQRRNDSGQGESRERTGKFAEIAAEKFTGYKFSKDSWGNSFDYDKPDLLPAGLKIGVKGCMLGFPLIRKNRPSTYPEIIVIVDSSEDFATILGLATPEVLNSSHYDDGIKSSNIKKQGIKTAFAAFEKLSPFYSGKELVSVANYASQYIDWD